MAFNIKNLKPNKNSRHNQGYFVPKNPNKYSGDLSKIIFRSGLEFKFCTFCDNNSNVIKWSSEPYRIPYWSPIDSKMHNYNVDYVLNIMRVDGTSYTMIVEVKPQSQLQKPKPPKPGATLRQIRNYNRELKTYIVNENKFAAATKWATEQGWTFKVVTENFF